MSVLSVTGSEASWAPVPPFTAPAASPFSSLGDLSGGLVDDNESEGGRQAIGNG